MFKIIISVLIMPCGCALVWVLFVLITRAPKLMATVGAICGVVLAIALFAAAVFLAVPTVEQIVAQGYTTTTGTITRSNIQRGRGSPRHIPMSSAEIVYTYRVAGRDYFSNCYRYGWLLSTELSGTAEAIVADFPVGKNVRVYYSPHDPSNAVLQPGIGASDLLMAMEELLLIIFSVLLLSLIVRSALGPRPRPIAGGHKVWDDGFRTRIRLADSAWKPALGTILLCAIGCGMGIAKLFGTNPPLKVALTGWGIILGAGAVTFLRRGVPAVIGKYDLVIDADRSLTLPRVFGCKGNVVVALGDVVSVEVEKTPKKGKGIYYIYVSVLVFNDPSGTLRRQKLRELPDQIRAVELVAWLRERLHIKAQYKPTGRLP